MKKSETSTSGEMGRGRRSSLRTQLFEAVKQKDLQKLRLLLQGGADPNCVFDDNINGSMTALHSSVLANSVEVVELLLEHGAGVNQSDVDGETPLFAANFDCDDRIREMLFQKGGDANFKDKSGKTPLMKTFEDSDMYGFKIRFSVIFDFLKRCNDFRQTDKEERSLLHLVSVIHEGCFLKSNEHECQKFLEFITKEGVDINATDCTGQTALHKASTSCCLDSVKFLIDKGSKAYHRDNNSKTALHCLGVNSHRDSFIPILNMLLEKGCRINEKDYLNRVPLHYVACSYNASENAIIEMVRKGADINLKDKYGMNALHMCVHPESISEELDGDDEIGQEDSIRSVIETLIGFGIGVNSTDNNKFTPLHYAVRKRNILAVQALLDLGANPYLSCKAGESVFHKAAIDIRTLKIIVDYEIQKSGHVDLTIVDNFGSTPLHWAVALIEPGAVDLLLDYQSDQLVDGKGRTPANLATFFKFACLYESLGIIYHRDTYPIQYGQSVTHYSSLFKLLSRNEFRDDSSSHVSLNELDTAFTFMQYINEGLFDYCESDESSNDKNSAVFHDQLAHSASSVDENCVTLEKNDNIDGIDVKEHQDAECDIKGRKVRDTSDDINERKGRYTGDDFDEKEDEDEVEDDGEDVEVECPKRDELYLDCPVLQTVYNKERQVSLVKWKSHLPMHQRSLAAYSRMILNAKDMGLVNDSYDNNKIASDILEIMEHTAEHVARKWPLLSCEVSLSGSRSEGTKICCPDEFDYSWNLTCLSEAFYPEESTSFPPEFVRLHLKEEFRDSKYSEFVTQDFTLDGRKLIRKLYMAINDVLCNQSIGNFDHIYCKKFLRIDKGSIDNLAFRWIGHVYKDLLVEVDIVPRLIFPDWTPNQIDLSSNLYKATSSRSNSIPFAVVLKTPDKRLVQEWQQFFRIDVAKLESTFIRQAPDVARKGYILLKALRDTLYMPQIFDEDRSGHLIKPYLTTYMLKTCLLDELNELITNSKDPLEYDGRHSDQRKESVLWAFKIMKRLISSVKKGYLKSFFAPDVNLLVNMSLEVVSDKYLIDTECICLYDLLLMGTADIECHRLQ